MKTFVAFLLSMVVVVVMLLWAAAGRAQVPPLQAFQEAKASGLLPAWVDTWDRVRVIPRYPDKAYLCIEDTGKSKNRLTLVGSLTRLTEFFDTGQITVAKTWQQAAIADIQTCFPDYVPPVALVPKALGEPVYKAMVRLKAPTLPYWRNDTPFDWVAMNRDYVVRSTTPGEQCGSRLSEAAQSVDTSVGWYHVAGGFTRCKPG